MTVPAHHIQYSSDAYLSLESIGAKLAVDDVYDAAAEPT